MPTLVSIYAPNRDELEALVEAFRKTGQDPGAITLESAGSDLHLDPSLLNHDMWRLLTVLVGGLGSGAGKAIAGWTFETLRNRKGTEPPVVIKLRGEKLTLRTAADREKLLTALEALDA